MIPATALGTFAPVALGMVLTPGPNMAYLVSRSVRQGRAAGLVSLGGVALGFVCYVPLAAFGITAPLFAVPHAHDALRLAGAACLAWLAWQAVRPGGSSPFAVRSLPPDSPRRLLAMACRPTCSIRRSPRPTCRCCRNSWTRSAAASCCGARRSAGRRSR